MAAVLVLPPVVPALSTSETADMGSEFGAE